MTFDSGITKIYSVENTSEPGELPVNGLRFKEAFYYSNQSLGITRFYEAIKANQLIERVIAIYRADLNINEIAVFEDGSQYVIKMIQPDTDEFGIDILKLSLEMNGDNYEIIE